MRFALAFCLSAILSTAAATSARAQRFAHPLGPPGQDAMEEGGRLYDEGRRAVDEYRWSDAIGPLQRAYELTGTYVALYGLALAFRATGRFRDARDAFDQLLDQHSAELDDAMRAQSEQMRQQAAASVAAIELLGLGGEGSARVELDGRDVVDDGSRPLPLEADPGTHSVRVDASGFVPFEWDGELTEGQRFSLEVELRPESSPIWTRPWLWAAAGGAVVVIVIIVAAVAQSEAQLDPRSEHSISL